MGREHDSHRGGGTWPHGSSLGVNPHAFPLGAGHKTYGTPTVPRNTRGTPAEHSRNTKCSAEHLAKNLVKPMVFNVF